MGVRTGRLVLAGIAAGGLLAGCGGETESALTRETYLARANAICESTNQRLEQEAQRAFPERGQIPSAERIESFVRRTAAPAFERQLDQIKELKPPSDDRPLVREMLDEGQKSLEKMRADPTGVQSNVQSPLLNFDRRATGFGLDKCRTGQKLNELTSGITRTPAP